MHAVQGDDEYDISKPGGDVIPRLPVGNVESPLDVLEVRAKGGFQSFRSARAPQRTFDSVVLCPTFALENQLGSIALIARLEVEAVGANVVVQRREEKVVLLALLDDSQRGIHPPSGEKRSAPEGVSQQNFVVARVVKRLPGRRNLAARDTAHDGGN